MDALAKTTASPGYIVTQWGFGFHQAVSGEQTVFPGSTVSDTNTAKLTSVGTAGAGHYERLQMYLVVDRGNGEVIYDVTLREGDYAGIDALRVPFEDHVLIVGRCPGHRVT